MMLSTLLLSGLLAAGEPAATKQSADAVQTELPKAPGEDQAPAGSTELDRDAKKAKDPDSGADGDRGRLKPGEKRETRDWADEERWGRYKKGQESDEEDPTAESEAPRRRHRARSEEGAGAQWPLPLRQRSVGGAFALGALVGFGAGHYYAGEASRGTMFTAIDAVLVLGFIGTTIAMNQLVIDHDFKTGRSLSRDERPMGGRESRLYVGSVIFALAEIGSRVFQGISAMQAARRTNEVLEGVTFVPIGPDGSIGIGVSF